MYFLCKNETPSETTWIQVQAFAAQKTNERKKRRAKREKSHTQQMNENQVRILVCSR